jgi:adenylate cyclase
MTQPKGTQARRFAAILMADVVGYSRLSSIDESGTVAEFKRHLKEHIRPALRRWSGRLVKTYGDGLLVEFASPVNAVECAVALQRRSAQRNADLRPDRQMLFRVGINLADVIVDKGDLLGDGVNVAARLQTIADPGGIAVSAAVEQHVKGKCSVAFEDLGVRAVKNIPEPIHVFRVVVGVQKSTPVEIGDKLAIAVLPFANMSGDDEQRYFSDGIAEDIITELSRFRTLAVVARNSSFVYREQAVDVKRVADELHVGFVVEGSVRKLDKRVRITVQLINAQTRRHVWAEKYDVELNALFAVQDDVTRRVVATLVPRMETEELEIARRRPPTDMRAYDCYLRGRVTYYAARDAAARTEARSLFEQAVALDPEFARAYCYLASIDNNLVTYSAGDPALLAARERAWHFATKAVTLDDSDPLTHLSMAWCHLWRREFDATRLHLDIATRLNPNDADRAMDRGTTLMYLGEPETAIEVMEAAMRLNPFHPDTYLLDMAEAYFVARRYDEMLKIASRVSDQSPKFTAWKAAAFAYLGRTADAHVHADRFITRMHEIWTGNQPATPREFASWVLLSCPFRRKEDSDHLLQGLEMAGIGGTADPNLATAALQGSP